MTGFFYDIRSLFTAKHSGKYLSMLLRELALREPKDFAKIFEITGEDKTALVKNKLQIEREWRFFGRQGNIRRADLALLKGGEPILLLEVKEDDVKQACY